MYNTAREKRHETDESIRTKLRKGVKKKYYLGGIFHI